MLEYNAMARRMPLKITRIQLQSTRRALPTFSIDDVLNFRAPLTFNLTGAGAAASAKEHTCSQMNLSRMLNLRVLGEKLVTVGCDRRYPFG